MTRLTLLAVALAAAPAAQVAPTAQVAYGDPVPLAADAFDVADGSQATLDAVAGPAGLAVVFWSNACPWADRYAPRLADLVRRYTPAGVGFALVNANRPAPGERGAAAASREATAAAGLAAPYLLDPDGRLAAAFGAQSAPHVYFFGPDRTLLYSGALDDSPVSAERVQVPYLAQAMDQSIAGLPVEVRQTAAFGCTIKRAAE